MSEKRAVLIKEVVAKLTELRGVLEPDAQIILDELICGPEVVAHLLDPGAVTPMVVLDKEQNVYAVEVT